MDKTSFIFRVEVKNGVPSPYKCLSHAKAEKYIAMEEEQNNRIAFTKLCELAEIGMNVATLTPILRDDNYIIQLDISDFWYTRETIMSEYDIVDKPKEKIKPKKSLASFSLSDYSDEDLKKIQQMITEYLKTLL